MPGESSGVNKSLHFVWAGAMMNEASQTVIKEWRQFLDSIKATERSENFTICVWLDADNSHPDVIAAIKEALGPDGIVYRDLNQLQQPGIKDVIDYEIKRLPPNYGAVSDIARYAILEQEGGMYLDTDVRPPGQGEFAATYQAVSDEQIFSFITAWLNKEAFMYCDAREDSQLAQAAPDLLISPKPHHPFLQAITKQVVKQYTTTYGYEAALSRAREIDIDTYESSPISTLSSQTYYARDPGVIHLTGVIKAGPSFFNHMLAVHGNHQVQAILERHLRTPLGITNSAYSWKARGIPKCASLEEVLERSRATIIFELEHTGILRMDDHLINALEALDGQGVEASEVKMQMLNLFNDLLSQEHFLPQIVCCQLTFAFKEVEELVTKFQLEDKTGLLPSIHLPSSSFLKGVQPHPGQINGDRSFSLARAHAKYRFYIGASCFLVRNLVQNHQQMSVKDLTSYKEYLGYIQEHVEGAISFFRDNYKGQKVEYKTHLSHTLSLAIDAKKQIETIISKKRARLPSFFSNKPDSQAIKCRFEELQRLAENLQYSLQEEVSATECNPPSSRPS